jgi:hypothetical protein
MAMIDTLSRRLGAFNVSYEAGKLKHKLWWRLMPGTEIVVRWPAGWTEPDDLGNQVQSVDPNDHYRPWMRANVGKQCWDWDWDIKSTGEDEIALVIKFRRGKESQAMQAWIQWG